MQVTNLAIFYWLSNLWIINDFENGYSNSSSFVKNTPLRVVFSTLFSVFGYPDGTLSLVFDLSLNVHFWVGVCVKQLVIGQLRTWFGKSIYTEMLLSLLPYSWSYGIVLYEIFTLGK